MFVFYPGGMGVNFVKQFRQAGLMKKTALLSAFTVDGTTISSLRDAAVGTVSGAMWDVALKTPGNAEFIASFSKKYGRVPSHYAAVGFDTAKLLDIALRLEEVALSDDFFISRKLYPNVDFYSGIILRALGFPTSMFTVLFALARTVGWISQWKEMIEDPNQKIGRPRQLYTGEKRRDYVPMSKR